MRDNSFDLLRLVAASTVLWGHCYPLARQDALDPALRYTRYQSLGEIAVDVFFIISGYLITTSYLRSRNWIDYLGKRALRLLPALWCAVALVALLLGPLVTRLPLREYFADPQTYAYLKGLYLNLGYVLPGVFVTNPYPRAVNGSLWTLPVEVFMYVLVMLLGMMRWLNRAACIAMVLLFLSLYFVVPVLGTGNLNRLIPLPYFETTHLGIYFFAGAVLAFVPQRPITRRCMTMAAALLLVLLADAKFASVWLIPLLPVLVIGLAHEQSVASRFVSRLGDFSYGVYVYAFPVQQTAAMLLGSGVSASSLFAWSMPATLLLASVSWYFVEKPCLDLKSRLFASSDVVDRVTAVKEDTRAGRNPLARGASQRESP